MFESFKRPFTRKGEITPQDVDDMKQNRAAALFAASVGAVGIAAINQAPVTDLHQQPQTSQEHKMTVADMNKMQEAGPGGATVSINHEKNEAAIVMPPPGDEKLVDITLPHIQTYTAHERPDGRFDMTKDEPTK